MNITIQTPKQSTWHDADGNEVPLKFVPKSDRVKEKLAGTLVKKALALEQDLLAFFTELKAGCDAVYNQMLEDYKIANNKERKIKGSYTWFNFDRSIKIEGDVKDLVKWDEAKMALAREHFDEYMAKNLSTTNELVRGLIQKAFSNNKGMIDTAQVFLILKYQSSEKDASFQTACDLMRNAHSVANSKKYYRVWVRQEDGQYRNVNLNFSSL
ncbi:DUF3164 family protein [Niabella sp. 22666]|uniref:DUF3164 family protein n=1 Tax=Niabella sp. 22666 TaxID=3453954 RepID=UPI003F858E69